jgi:hypothetical protein
VLIRNCRVARRLSGLVNDVNCRAGIQQRLQSRRCHGGASTLAGNSNFFERSDPKFEETESRKFLFALNDVDLQRIPVEFHCCAHAAAVTAGFFAVGKRLDAPNSAPSF